MPAMTLVWLGAAARVTGKALCCGTPSIVVVTVPDTGIAAEAMPGADTRTATSPTSAVSVQLPASGQSSTAARTTGATSVMFGALPEPRPTCAVSAHCVALVAPGTGTKATPVIVFTVFGSGARLSGVEPAWGMPFTVQVIVPVDDAVPGAETTTLTDPTPATIASQAAASATHWGTETLTFGP